MIEGERLRRRLSDYIRSAWHIVEPATIYTHGWHIDAICDHLEAVTSGEIRNLIINVPPRHMKSLSVAVFWPTWVWASSPEIQWLFSSYAEPLAVRDSVKCRRMLASQWYKARWGHVFRIMGDENRKVKFSNNMGGHRIAVGTGGGATGTGGDIIVVDDPMKAGDADSQAILEEKATWWDETMSTRGNDPRTVKKVIIMQRLNEGDLTGHILSKMREGGTYFEHLCLPAEYEPTTYTTSIGWQDPRKEADELLWGDRFGEEELISLKSSLGERGTAGQLQQRPAPIGGATYKRDWWDDINRYDPDDRQYEVVATWLSVDTALKESESHDFSAISIWDLTSEYRIALTGVWKMRVPFPSLVQHIERIAKEANVDGRLRGVVIEDKQSGTSAIQSLRAGAPEWLRKLIFSFSPRGDKVYRARQASLWCERGAVLLPYPAEGVGWLFNFEAGLFTFPAVVYDDVEDTFSQMIIYLEHYLSAYWQRRVKQMRANAA